MQEVLLYYEKQTVPRFSAALAVKNKDSVVVIMQNGSSDDYTLSLSIDGEPLNVNLLANSITTIFLT